MLSTDMQRQDAGAPRRASSVETRDGAQVHLELSEASLCCCAAVLQPEGCDIAH